MYINELYDKLPLLSAETYTYISRDGDCHTESEPVLTEHILDVYLNDRLTMKLVCIPQYLTELVLGLPSDPRESWRRFRCRTDLYL